MRTGAEPRQPLGLVRLSKLDQFALVQHGQVAGLADAVDHRLALRIADAAEHRIALAVAAGTTTGGIAAGFNAYQIDDAAFQEGLRLFRANIWVGVLLVVAALAGTISLA